MTLPIHSQDLPYHPGQTDRHHNTHPRTLSILDPDSSLVRIDPRPLPRLCYSSLLILLPILSDIIGEWIIGIRGT